MAEKIPPKINSKEQEKFEADLKAKIEQEEWGQNTTSENSLENEKKFSPSPNDLTKNSSNIAGKPQKTKTRKPWKNPFFFTLSPFLLGGLAGGFILGGLAWVLLVLFSPDNSKIAAASFVLEMYALENEEEEHGQAAALEPPPEIRERLKEEFKLHLAKVPTAPKIFGKCWIAHHQIHVIDSTGRIIEHYEETYDDWSAQEKMAKDELLETEHRALAFVYSDRIEFYDDRGEIFEKIEL